MKQREAISMVQRRAFMTLMVGAATWSAAARAQQTVRRIGFLRVGPPPASFIDGFRSGLRDLGFVEGRHFVIEYGLAETTADVSRAATELVRRKVDVLVASGTPSVLPARDAAAGHTPVVFIATFDPVATGIVASLARPGGNITGTTSISGDIIAKRLQLLGELLPKATRVAILVRTASPTQTQYVEESGAAARTLGIELQIVQEPSAADLDRIFVAVRGADALVVADDAEFTAHRAQIAMRALRSRLPTLSGFREMAEAGGLMAYGASFSELYRRAASHVYKILHGANPADLPVEQPTKIELVLNLRTAKAIGLDIPTTLLARADEVIE